MFFAYIDVFRMSPLSLYELDISVCPVAWHIILITVVDYIKLSTHPRGGGYSRNMVNGGARL